MHKRPARCPSTARGSSRRVTGRERRERVALLTGGVRSVRVENRCRAEKTRGWRQYLSKTKKIHQTTVCSYLRGYETIKSNRERLQRALRVSLNLVTFALEEINRRLQSGLINSVKSRKTAGFRPAGPHTDAADTRARTSNRTHRRSRNRAHSRTQNPRPDPTRRSGGIESRGT